MTLVSTLRHAVALSAALMLAVAQGVASNAAPRTSWKQGHVNPPIQGNAPIAAWSRGDVRCFEYPNYTVSESTTTRRESMMSTIAVRTANTKCTQINETNNKKPIFVIQQEFEFFQGLAGNVLITDSGSGPDFRLLTLYDIRQKSKFLQLDDYSDEGMALKSNKLIVWRKTSNANPNNCPQYNLWTSQSLGAVIETQISIDLASHRVVTTAKQRCRPRQVPQR